MTGVRILLIPVLVWLILADTNPTAIAAGVLFAAAAATDRLDGYLARRYESDTRTGRWLDPFADKLLIAAPVLTLVALDRFPVWAAAIIVAREVAVSLLRGWLGLRDRSLPASQWGKWKAGVQMVAIFLYIVPVGAGVEDVRLWVLVVATALTVWSGLDYVLKLGRRARAEMED